jgi:predicted transcriptional regulator
MKKITTVIAGMAVAAFLSASLVQAGECPLLIKQLKEGVTKVSDTSKKAEAEKLIAEAQTLHDQGKHTESVAKAEEAAKVAGVTLQHKKM